MTARKIKMVYNNVSKQWDLTDEHNKSCRHKHSYLDDGDTFQWEPTGHPVSISFPHGNPFDPATPPPYPANAGGSTAPVTVTNGGGQYKYTISVTDASGISPDDPHVIIDNGTGIMLDDDSRSLNLLGDPGGAREAVKDLLKNTVAQLKAANDPKDGGPVFFKDGIDLISVDVEVTPVKVTVEVAGPKSASN